MKEISKKLLLALMTFVFAFTFSACGGDDDDEPAAKDYASKISGVYTGQLSSGGHVIEDVYVVNIYRISNGAVTVNADFFGSSTNFNVTYSNGIYTLSSANYDNITIYVQNKTLTITFLNAYGTMTTFSGVRD